MPEGLATSRTAEGLAGSAGRPGSSPGALAPLHPSGLQRKPAERRQK